MNMEMSFACLTLKTFKGFLRVFQKQQKILCIEVKKLLKRIFENLTIVLILNKIALNCLISLDYE